MDRAVLIKTDASTLIGNGHSVRCAVLAETLRLHEFTVEFVCRELPGNRISWLEQKGFHVWRLPAPATPIPFDPTDCTTWTGVSPEADAKQTLEMMSVRHYAWLIVDHYGLAEAQHRLLAELAEQVLVIDDLADRLYYADLFLDTTLNRTETDYSGLVPERCQLLLGTDYALLRSEFAALRDVAQQKRAACTNPSKLLIACGATDPANISLQVLQALNTTEWMQLLDITVVLASNARYLPEVRQFCEGKEHVHLLENVADMAALMVEHDIAVGAAGSGVWERACLGLPSLVVVTGVDQTAVMQALDARGAVLRANPPGHHLVNTVLPQGGFEPEFFLGQLQKLYTTPDLYRELVVKSLMLCDGLGAGRVADAMLSAMSARRV